MGIHIREILTAQEIQFDDLKGKIVAVDFFNVIYQFLASIRMANGSPLTDSHGHVTSHLQGLLTRSINLMEKGVKLVYVFDGKPHPLKYAEREKRTERKLAARDKYNEAVAEEDVAGMAKYAKQHIYITDEMLVESKELLKALGLPVVQAPCEGEAQAAYMALKGDCWAVASQDADCLLFGAPRLIRNLTLSLQRKLPSGKVVHTYLELLTLQDVLRELGITREQLIYLGMLIGTDFNPGGVKGVGPRKGLKLVKEKQPSELFSDFDWEAVRDVFLEHPITDDYDLIWKAIDRKKVFSLLVEKHDFDQQRVEAILDKVSVKGQKGLRDFF